MQVGVDFTHVIMTRFNVERPRRHDPMRLDPDWLAGRFDLFEKYCLPSVAAQTARDFHWLVYFDAGTPEPIRRRIAACREVFPFVPWFCRADQRRVLAGLARRGAAGADALAAHHPLRQRRRARRRPRRPAAGGGGARGAAAGLAELPAGLRAGRGRQALRAHPPRQLVRELARALGREGAHRDLDQPPEDDPGRTGPPARRRRRLAAGRARRQRLEQGARPPGRRRRRRPGASPPRRSPACAAPRGSRSRSRTWCSPRSAAPATPRSR